MGERERGEEWGISNWRKYSKGRKNYMRKRRCLRGGWVRGGRERGSSGQITRNGVARVEEQKKLICLPSLVEA